MTRTALAEETLKYLIHPSDDRCQLHSSQSINVYEFYPTTINIQTQVTKGNQRKGNILHICLGRHRITQSIKLCVEKIRCVALAGNSFDINKTKIVKPNKYCC